ncbi:hypothetical protein JHK87_036220 [Glycine soja]|nr:hypothetical protein JHK87_036220 [Glycine soja]
MATCLLRVGRFTSIDSRSLFVSTASFSSSFSSPSSSVFEEEITGALIRHLSLSRSETDMINVVEQRIWHSMEEGQFENLPGKGKPLKLDTNPHADPAEDTLYRILSKNGCAPEWVELNKEIRSKISEWRKSLKKAWATKCSGDHSEWVESTEALKSQLREINDKVFRYNLIVPFGRQMFGLKWEKELDDWNEMGEGFSNGSAIVCTAFAIYLPALIIKLYVLQVLYLLEDDC